MHERPCGINDKPISMLIHVEIICKTAGRGERTKPDERNEKCRLYLQKNVIV